MALVGDAPPAHRVATVGSLDLDDIGPVVTEELAGERARDEVAELEHSHAGERTDRRGLIVMHDPMLHIARCGVATAPVDVGLTGRARCINARVFAVRGLEQSSCRVFTKSAVPKRARRSSR